MAAVSRRGVLDAQKATAFTAAQLGFLFEVAPTASNPWLVQLPSATTDRVGVLTSFDPNNATTGVVEILGGVYTLTAGTGGVTVDDELEPEAATGKAVTHNKGRACGRALQTAAANAQFLAIVYPMAGDV